MNRIELSTIGGNVSLGGGGRAPKPEDCMKDCIAWYSPKRQGITNEYLQDHYLDDDAVLQDLSGNGNDIALHNMEGEEGGGYVDENGDLVFDGVDDYGRLKSFSLGESAAFAVDGIIPDGETLVNNPLLTIDYDQNKYALAIRTYGTNKYIDYYINNGCRFLPLQNDNNFIGVINLHENESPHLYVGGSILLCSGNLNKDAVFKRFSDMPLEIGRRTATYGYPTFKQLLFFNRELTRAEAEWVYDNILTTDNNNQNS